MKYIKGNLLDLAESGIFDVIVHGCNCHHAMASGIAGQIAKRYPQAVLADDLTPFGSEFKLGSYSSAPVYEKKNVWFFEINRKKFTVINAYTQFHPGKDLRYAALRKAFEKIARDFPTARIGIPKIGAGIAGGDWEYIETIIDNETLGMDITCVEYAP